MVINYKNNNSLHIDNNKSNNKTVGIYNDTFFYCKKFHKILKYIIQEV